MKVQLLKIGFLLILAWIAFPASFGQTLYSYQSGAWNASSTWTTDPSGTLWVNAGALTPTGAMSVIILNGRAVSTSAGCLSQSLEIREGGVLDLAATIGHNFGTVSGKGTLRLSSNTFPGGTYTAFISALGGTVEYYNMNNTCISNTQLTYNNLIVSNNTAGANSVYLDNNTSPTNYTINGNLFLKNNSTGSLTFNIGNPTASNNKININVYGNVTVGTGCSIRVNNFAAAQPYNDIHNLNIYGDFTNNGSVRFTGLPSPVVNAYYLLATTAYGGQNYGAVKVTFSGASNNTLTCNGITDFYRFIIDKGIDQTYKLEVLSSNVANFAVYGPNNQGGNIFSPPNPDKAIFIANGTLKLNDNINIPSLTEGGQDFNLVSTASLWVNGATVSTTVTGFNGTGYQAATLYGRLRISSGFFTTGDAAGIVLGSIATPEIMVEGSGTLSASQVLDAGGGNKISFIQTGGTVNIRLQGEPHAGYMLNLADPNTVFTMSGGTLNFLNNLSVNGALCTQIFNIQSAAGNYRITGGTVNINMPGNYTDTINSTIPFYNLNISRQSGINQITILSVSNISVLNDLTLNANTVLDAATHTVNLSVGNNFIMDAASVYNCGNNTTIFNGAAVGQRFANAGVINGGTGLNNLIISNNSNTDIFTQDIILRGNLTINANCYLNDFGNTINVAGNIINSGTHTSQANGGILLNGTGAQTIGGFGNGVFGNLQINKTSGTASLTANQTLTGTLRLANGLLDINVCKLTLGTNSNVYDALTGTTSVFSGTKMIRTSGNQSDGGVTKIYNNNTAFIFPIGTGTDYTPGTIGFTIAPATYGSVNIKPVAHFQPFVSSNNSLDYYWKVTSSGFTNLKPASVSHIYQYVDADWAGRGDVTNYIPGVYCGSQWISINDVAEVVDANNEIYFTNVDYLNGDFTAGQPDAFGPVLTYYSRTSGNWSDGNTWSTDSVMKWDGPAAGSYPGVSNPVIIGDGISHNHTITITANGMLAGALQISGKSVLDLGTTINHNFGSIVDPKTAGHGKLRISSASATATFPAGDFGLFLNTNGGTVEYYSTGTTDFTLPVIDHYKHLAIQPSTGRMITMPDVNMTVYGNLIGNGTGTINLNAISARTLNVNDSLNINSGTLRFQNNQPQTLNISKDVVVGNGAQFISAASGTAVANTLTINGNLTNNGIFDMNPDNTRYCDVTFIGVNNAVVNGTGTTTDFNRLTINKGTSPSSILNVTSSAFSLTNGALATSLFLPNGTFRLTSALSITLSTSGTFTIPATGCLSANGGTINVGISANNNGDLLLAGRLEVIGGNVNVGLAANNNNNDIEYASAGSPQIIVQGGSLFVNGQIRRNTVNTLGSLIYNQSNGTVTINGQNQNATRAKFEITNSSSSFTMSGGSLVILRAGGTTYGDIYLNPEINSVTGGTIQVGNSSSPAGQVFALNSAIPLWNLTVDGTTNAKTLSIQVNNLKLKNNLSINGNSSVFSANGLNVNIGGNLINQNTSNAVGLVNGGYQPGTATQLTTFDGSTGNQSITGVAGNLTNFAKVEINNTFSPGRITLNANTAMRVNADLTLTHGILNDGGNTITVIGNISNSAVHESPSGNGIVLNGTARQVISGNGNGQFGNLLFNNTNDIYMVDNTTINNNLTFTNGNLYIDDYLLTFGQNASVAGAVAGPPSRMIISNGVMSDFGVRKNYPASPSTFTFPLGVAGKYTPVTINLTANTSAGSITVKPVNNDHPSLQDASGNELHFYWSVVSSGFGAVTATQDYSYVPTDVSGNENLYYCGRFFNSDWTPAGGIAGVVNAVTHHITLTGVSYIDGEYTAGETANFTAVATYYSITSGNWEVPGTWSTVGPTGPPAASTPNGHKVIIAAGHTVTVTADSKKSYSLALNGTLELGTTVYHSLGYVTGNGTIRLTSTAASFFVLPGGNFDVFMNNPQSLIVFTGNTTATLPANIGTVYKPYQNVLCQGNGIKNLAFINMKVRGYLTINQGKLSNADANKNIYILGNWNDSVPSGFVPGTGLVSFEGTSVQKIYAISGEQFYNLQINNTSGVTLSNNVNVSKGLYLAAGNFNTSVSALLTLTNNDPYSVTGGSSSSFVNGPMAKAISSGSFFNFPTGKNGRYGSVNVNNTSTGLRTWTAEYYNSNPLVAGMDPAIMQLPIDSVSNNEYWQVNGGTTAIQANVRIRWDNQSAIIPADSLTRVNKVRIVEWNGLWQNRGGVVTDGGVSSGTVQTSSPITLNNNHFFTLGLEIRPTATITSGTTGMCNNGVDVNIPVTLTGVSPWTLRYTINGANETTISNIGTSPFNIVANYPYLSSLGGGPNYVYTISYVSDAFGITGINNFVPTATIILLDSPVPVISGNTSVCKNETNVTYNTPDITGHTYNWSVVGGTIASGQGTYQITVNWGNGSAGSVRVTETNIATGCVFTATQNIIITNAPTPLVIGNNSVCANSNEVYYTAPASDHNFLWTVSGGSVVSGQGTNRITVHWNSDGTGTVTVKETVKATGAFASNTLNVTINSLPLSNLIVTDPKVNCSDSAHIVVQGAEGGTDYTLRLNSDSSAVDTVHNASAGDVTFTVAPLVNTTYNILATNEYGCSVQLTDLSLVTIEPPLIGPIISDPSLIRRP